MHFVAARNGVNDYHQVEAEEEWGHYGKGVLEKGTEGGHGVGFGG